MLDDRPCHAPASDEEITRARREAIYRPVTLCGITVAMYFIAYHVRDVTCTECRAAIVAETIQDEG